jgi:NADP-reducing hydrogenase subunit HndB
MAKTLKELEEIRKQKLEEINLRKGREGYRVVVGMATCGIAAGARPVMLKMMEEVEALGIEGVTVEQTGCIGACRLEPIVEVYDPEGNKTTYIKMDEDKAAEVVEKHLRDNQVVEEYIVTMIDGKVIDPVEK